MPAIEKPLEYWGETRSLSEGQFVRIGGSWFMIRQIKLLDPPYDFENYYELTLFCLADKDIIVTLKAPSYFTWSVYDAPGDHV